MGKYLNICITILFLIILSSNCYASETSNYYEEFIKVAPDEFSDLQQEEALELVGVKSIFNRILDAFLKDFNNSLKLMSSIVSIVLAFSIINKFENENKLLKQTVRCTFSVVIMAICFNAIENCIDKIISSVESTKVFSASSIPIILGLCVASASSFSGVVFSTSVSFISVLMETVSNNILIPLTVIFLSFAIIGTCSSHINFIAIDEQIKKFVKWVIGIFMTLFSFTMILQNFLSVSSDSVLKHSIKSAVGSFIPVVGSTLSSSVDSIFTIVSNTKSIISVIGVVVIFSMFLPSLSITISYGLAMSVSKFFAMSLDQKELGKSIGTIADAFYILSAICASCVVMMILSFLVICINIG